MRNCRRSGRSARAASAPRPYWELSGGQNQRVLIARALAGAPEVLFLDEPTAGVDRDAEEAIIALIAELNRERGMTVVLVSHHLGRIQSVVRSVIIVDAGRADRRALGQGTWR